MHREKSITYYSRIPLIPLSSVDVFFGRYSGVTGTLAVISALVFQVDAFGSLHWDSHDAIVGILLILPLHVLGEFPGRTMCKSMRRVGTSSLA
eukprot:862579-Prorocentrum_minimum.AAC.4